MFVYKVNIERKIRMLKSSDLEFDYACCNLHFQWFDELARRLQPHVQWDCVGYNAGIKLQPDDHIHSAHAAGIKSFQMLK